MGVAREPLTPSYDTGNPPSEAFMERPQDITTDARTDASTARELSAALVNPTDIDSIAQAIRDNHGCVLGVTGSNNGTWISPFPKPPTAGEQTWGHWLYAGKAKMINGVKFIGFINSWGTNVGEQGWQWVSEDYLAWFFNVWTMVFGTLPPPPPFHHTFSTNMKLGDRATEVQALQQALKVDGDFPPGLNITGYHRDIT